VIYTLLYRLLAAREEADSETEDQTWQQRLRGLWDAMPWFALVITTLAFAAWVFAIPDSPFNSFDFYTAELGGAVGTAAATLIATVGAAFGYAGAVRPGGTEEPAT
jgi:membrane protease YdiL (CAAX protease family)